MTGYHLAHNLSVAEEQITCVCIGLGAILLLTLPETRHISVS
jgi:hypothetical protein